MVFLSKIKTQSGEVEGVSSDVEIDISLHKNSSGVFEWVVDVPKIDFFVKNEIVATFDPFSATVKIKEVNGIIDSGGFYITVLELDTVNSVLTISF